MVNDKWLIITIILFISILSLIFYISCATNELCNNKLKVDNIIKLKHDCEIFCKPYNITSSKYSEGENRCTCYNNNNVMFVTFSLGEYDE